LIMADWPRRPAIWILITVVVAYCVLGVLYAIYTPSWQAPDEPAHYNYVRYLVEQRRLPVLQVGDYPHAYLKEITGAKFPPEMTIDPIRYEFWQPPLYYLLAVPIYLLFGGALIPLRLFSVACGAGLLIVAYGIVHQVFPRNEVLALGAVAMIAFIPQHLAMTAAVNNDALAELILAGVVWRLVRYVASDGQMGESSGELRGLAVIGVLMGLGLLTKTSTVISVPLAVVALPLCRKRVGALSVVCLLLPALLLVLPWLVRNATVYGGLDVFGWNRHSAVVAEQPRTAEWVALYGLGNVFRWGLTTTFQSFWAQFGWMAVPIDPRIYLALALFSGLAGVGFALLVMRVWQERDLRLDEGTHRAASLLALWLLLTGASYLWYNTTFVQHQGRYLFPALVPIAVVFALGWREALWPDNARWLAVTLLVGAGVWVVRELASGQFSKTTVALTGGAAVLLGGQSFLTERFRLAAFALPYLGLAALALVCPFVFIVPYLSVS
jgi:4-amino-4-deoxy-L-arabinose transferase-like glycosyltransferase